MHSSSRTDQDFQSIFDSLPVPLAVHDSLGNMLFFNKAFAHTFGYTTEDIPTLDAWWLAAYPDPEYRQGLADIWQNYMEEAKRTGKAFTPMEANVRCMDGSVRTVHCTAAPMDELGGCHLAILHDITEHKRISDELRMTRISVEAASDAIYWITADARIIDVNAAARHLLGYTREELLQMYVFDLDPNYSREMWEQSFPELRQKGTLKLESVHRAKDGRLIPIEVVANYVRFGEQELNCAFCRDITKRKQNEEERQRLHRQLQLALQSANAGVWEWEYQTGSLTWSDELYRLFGFDPNATGTISIDLWKKALHPEDLPRLLTQHEAAVRRQERLAIEYRIVLPSGAIRWAYDLGDTYRDECGNPLGRAGICFDITKHKTAEELLRISEEKFSKAFHNGPMQMALSDLASGKYLDVNEAFCQLSGFSKEEVIGRTSQELGLIKPEDREPIYQQLKSEGRISGLEFKVKRKNGDEVWCQYYGETISTSSGEMLLSIAQDITARKTAELSLAQAKEAAETANRAKSEFFANMSHEIRTPINGILGMAQLLEYTELSANQKDYLEAIHHSSESLLALVNDILDLAKIESGKIELEYAEFSLRGSLSDVIRSQIAIAHAKGLSLKTVIPADVPDDLTGDQLRLKQILSNLVGNAIKFTETGVIALSITLEERRKNTALLRFEVTDSGIGIKDEVIEKIFNPFSQADASMTRRFGGSGLGLAICSQLTKLMGGEIAVASRVGVGSTFQVRLPFAVNDVRPARSDLHKAGSSPVWEGAPCRVLLAEDNDTSRVFFAEVLKKYGHQVDIAVDGAEALEKWTQSVYDLILMDVQMPVMDGIETIGKLREMEKHQGGHVPVIALTAHAMAGYRSELLRKGFDGYVSKPARIRELFSELKRCLAERSS